MNTNFNLRWYEKTGETFAAYGKTEQELLGYVANASKLNASRALAAYRRQVARG